MEKLIHQGEVTPPLGDVEQSMKDVAQSLQKIGVTPLAGGENTRRYDDIMDHNNKHTLNI